MSDTSGQQPPVADYASGATPSKDERMWAMFCHLGGLIFFIPFGTIIAPLVIWLIKKDEYPFVNDQGKEAINFQITVFIAFVICAVLTLVFIGFLLALALLVCDIVLVIMATIRANAGQAYRYPYALRLIK